MHSLTCFLVNLFSGLFLSSLTFVRAVRVLTLVGFSVLLYPDLNLTSKRRSRRRLTNGYVSWVSHRRIHHLTRMVYDGFLDVKPAQWFDFYCHRAVVTPTNDTADALNSTMLQRLDASTEIVSLSTDSAMADVSLDDSYTPEFLNSLSSSGLPPHDLRLRRGSLVMLLRSYAPHKGLCNGTRMVVERMHKHLLQVRIVTGPFSGFAEFIPRITCDSAGDSELPFAVRRHQYPLRHAWAMTINKSQGQSIRGRLGIYLPAPVFAHGQLYVAFSRGIAFNRVRIVIRDNGDNKQRLCRERCSNVLHLYTLNVVDRALLRCSRESSHARCHPPFSAGYDDPPRDSDLGTSSQGSVLCAALSPEAEAFAKHEEILRERFKATGYAFDESLQCEPQRPPRKLVRVMSLAL